jgi:hypothetical protein
VPVWKWEEIQKVPWGISGEYKGSRFLAALFREGRNGNTR